MKKHTWMPLGILLFVIVASLVYFLASGTESPYFVAEGCLDVLINGDPEEKVNIVYVNSGYSDGFSDAVEEFNGWMSIEPYEGSDKFNIYAVDASSDVGCETDSGTVVCDSGEAKKLVGSLCPYDIIVVLNYYSATKDLLFPLRSAALGNIVYVNGADVWGVLAHELGHALGDLDDEYLISGGSPSYNSKNCLSDCSEFDAFGVGCYSGCSSADHYRSIEDGLMKQYWREDSEKGELYYGGWNVDVISGVMESGLDGFSLFDSPVKKSAILEFDANDNLVSYSEGEYNFPKYSVGDYSYSVLGDGEELYSLNFAVDLIIEPREIDGEFISGEVVDAGYVIVVPIVDEAENVVVYDDEGLEVAEVSFGGLKFSVDSNVELSFEKSVFNELYLVKGDEVVSSLDLGCEDYCRSGSVYVPLLDVGFYSLYYYNVNDGWNFVTVELVSSGGVLEWEI